MAKIMQSARLATESPAYPCERSFRKTPAKFLPHFQAQSEDENCMQLPKMQLVLTQRVDSEFHIWWSKYLKLLLYLYVGAVTTHREVTPQNLTTPAP